MRSRVIMLLGALLAVGIDVVWLWPELPTPTVVLGNLPFLVAIGLGAYSAFSLLVSAVLIVDLCRIRARLKSLVSPSRQAWDAAFTGTSLTRVALRLVEFVRDGDADPENQVLVRSRLNVAEPSRNRTAVLEPAGSSAVFDCDRGVGGAVRLKLGSVLRFRAALRSWGV